MRLEGVGFEEAAVLPPFKRIIFDEAHAIEQSATSFFSKTLSKSSVIKQVNRIYRMRRGKAAGLAIQIERQTNGDTKSARIPGVVQKVRDIADALNAAAASQMNENSIRLAPGVANPLWESLREDVISLQNAILDLTSLLEGILSSIDENEGEESVSFEAAIVVRRLLSYSALCEQIREYDSDTETVYWLDRRRSFSGETIVDFTATPLNISHVMQEAIFSTQDCVVFTSATLSIRNSFDYWLSRVGLEDIEEPNVDVAIFPSPFPYEDRVLLGIPHDAPDPGSDAYFDFVSTFTAHALEISEGKGLVLFTSYQMLTYVYEQVKPTMHDLGITLMKQGDDDRSRLLSEFNSDAASVLFATDSFWQGVDVPGDALRLVIICRLPFRVPTDPVHVARMDAIRIAGGNPFIELALPEAVTKFKQGFGRLMRRATDRGAVLVLDSRIAHKSYGALFIESLPKTLLSTGESGGVLQDLEAFLYPAEL